MTFLKKPFINSPKSSINSETRSPTLREPYLSGKLHLSDHIVTWFDGGAMNRDCNRYRQSHCCGVREFSSIGVVSQASSNHVQLDWLKSSCHFSLDDTSSICGITTVLENDKFERISNLGVLISCSSRLNGSQ